MPLTVLNVAYPLAPVGLDAVGGAEQIVAQLDAALTSAGHRSIVIACEGSRVSGTLLATLRLATPFGHHLVPAAQAWHREAVAVALARWPIDVVHLHGIDFHAYLPPAGVPALVTLHLPPAWYAPEAWSVRRPDTHFHCVSMAQRRALPAAIPLGPEIENGVPVSELGAVRPGKRGFVFALGRICWEKGFHVALDAAKRAGVALLLAGEVFGFANHQTYFRDYIAPKLDARRRFLGPVGFARKRRLLSAARALLVSSLVPETGSLAAMEALACGTPVIAFRFGALPDVIEHGVTGFLVDSPDEMAAAIAAVGSIDPEACRAAARRRFSLRRMTDEYLERYEQLARTTAVPAAEAVEVSDAA